MKVFADHHHAALFHSLQLLFEGRLEWELYRPIGPEWHTEGYWHVYDHPHTVNQFLGLHQGREVPMDVHSDPLIENECKNKHYTVEDGVYYVYDPVHNLSHKAVTLDKFKEMDFDILISSIPAHIQPFNKLIAQFQPKAKHIFQVGNAWGHQPGVANIMASTAPFPAPSDVNCAFYHQEFDLDTYRYAPPRFHNVVNSYIHYMKAPELMDNYAGNFPGWQWTKYGAGMDLSIMGVDGVGNTMQRSAWTWHYKPEGDGYGHVIFSSYACGRPAIIWGDFYRGKLAEHLLEDTVTCIDISKHSAEENIRTIHRLSEPEEHTAICERSYERFRQVVDFDQEFEQLKVFLENLR
jgi:hypothetical protein